MGDDYRNHDRRDPCCDPCRPIHPQNCDPCRPQPPCDPCDPCNPCKDDEGNSWIWILVIAFLLLGGGNLFGGNDGCCDNRGDNSWLLILVVLFLFCQNQNDGRNGLFGGLF